MFPNNKETKKSKRIFVWLIFIAVMVLLIVLSFKLFYYSKEEAQSNIPIFKTPPLVNNSDNHIEAYRESLRNETSDIEGLSKLDKYDMGLNPNDGSDSDGDGLTDKEELEIYNSDPLKKSTAGDLYDDAYKISHGMDVNTSYDYEGTQSFEWNECDEIELHALVVDDFYAVVQDITKGNTKTEDIISAYRIYNFSGLLSMDCSQFENLPEDIDVLIKCHSNSEAENVKTENDGTTIRVEYSFDNTKIYDIYITEHAKASSLKGQLSAKAYISADSTGTKERGQGLLFGPTFFGLFDVIHLNIWVEDIGEYTDYEKQALIDEINHNWIADSRKGITSLDDPRISVVDGEKIKSRYELLQRIVPFFEYTSDDDLKFWHALYAFKSLENEERYDQLIEEGKKVEETDDSGDKDSKSESYAKNIVVTTGFDVVEDEFSFENFGSYISPDGNCAGISHFTSSLFNHGYVSGMGNQEKVRRIYNYEDLRVVTDIGDIEWDISSYDENQTLLTPTVSDYKEYGFLSNDIKEYCDEDDYGHIYKYMACNYENLSVDEQNFVDMIGCYQYYANTLCVNSCLAGVNNYSYQTIEIMKEYLDEGHVVKVATNLGDGGHMVVIYGYEYNEVIPDQTIFYVYDSNLPNVDKDICKMVITRLKSPFGNDDTFAYDYWPAPDEYPEYRMTSYVGYGEEFFFELSDDQFNILTVY